MPTIDVLEGFEHQVPSSGTVGVPASAGTPLYAAVTTGGSISYTSGRLAGQALHVVENGATSVRQDWPASTTRVFYGWFRVPSAPSFDRSTINVLLDTGTVGQAATATIRTAANGSVIEMQCGTGTRRAGPNVADNAWHLLEYRFIGATTSWTVDWAVDGVTQTQATFTGAAANTTTRMHFGSASASHTCTVDWDDVVGSVTSGDYQISSSVTGGFAVRPYLPTGEGTDVIGTTNAITFTGASTGWECTDEWPADDTTYITYASTTTGDAASNYAEITMANLEADVTAVWGVNANLAAFANGTGADVLKVRALDSSNNILAEVTDTSFDVSETTLRYWRKMLTTPGGGFLTDFNGFKFRVGLSTDTNAIPRASALMLQAAVLYASNADHTTTTVVSSASFPAPTSAATAAHTTTTVASVAALYTPTVAATAAITTTTVAAVASVPTPDVVTATPDAEVTTATVAALASILTPTALPDTRASPDVIAALAATYTPTVVTTAAVTTTSVAVAASVPAPTVAAVTPITTATIAAVAAVPSVTVAATAAITTTTVAGAVAVPSPTVAAVAAVTTTSIASTASVPTPTVVVTSNIAITTATVAAVAAVPTPTVVAESVAAVTTTTIAVTASIPAPASVKGNAGRGAGGIVRTVVVFSPTIAARTPVTTTTVAASASIPTPTVAATAARTAGPTTAAASVPTPTVAAPAAVTTTTVARTVSIPSPTVAWTADTVSATVSVPTPVVAATADVTTDVVAVAVAIPSDDVAHTSFEVEVGTIAVAVHVPGAGIVSYTIGLIYKKAGTTGGAIHLRAGTATIHKKAGTIEIVRRAGSDPYIEKRGSA